MRRISAAVVCVAALTAVFAGPAVAQDQPSNGRDSTVQAVPEDLRAYLKCKAKLKANGFTDLQAHVFCRHHLRVK